MRFIITSSFNEFVIGRVYFRELVLRDRSRNVTATIEIVRSMGLSILKRRRATDLRLAGRSKIWDILKGYNFATVVTGRQKKAIKEAPKQIINAEICNNIIKDKEDSG